MRVLLVLLAVVVALSVPASTARARSSGIYDYQLELTPRADGTAHFWIRILWDPFADVRLNDEFQYVGREEPRSVVAYDDDGAPLAISVLTDWKRPGWTLHYKLAPPRRGPTGNMQEVVIEFDQKLDATPVGYTWGGRTVTLPWALELDSRPCHSRYRVRSDVGAVGDFSRADDPEEFHCGDDMRSTARFEFVLEPPSAAALVADIGAALAGLGLSVLILGARLRRLRREAIRERGVVPESAPPPSDVQAGYRAPPARGAPELSPKDRRSLQRSTLFVTISLIATFAATLFMRRASVPIGIVSGVVTLGGALFLVVFLVAKRRYLIL